MLNLFQFLGAQSGSSPSFGQVDAAGLEAYAVVDQFDETEQAMSNIQMLAGGETMADTEVGMSNVQMLVALFPSPQTVMINVLESEIIAPIPDPKPDFDC